MESAFTSEYLGRTRVQKPKVSGCYPTFAWGSPVRA